MADPRRYSFRMRREQIASFVKDPRTIREIEALQRAVTETTPQDIADLDDAKADKTTQIIGGAGLTGTHDLSADVTLNIGAGTGITVNADDVAIDIAAETERIQDVIGAAATDTATIDMTYNDVAGTITADVKAGSIGPTELASTAVTPASYGDSTHVAAFTVDADGRLTAASSVAISFPSVAAGAIGPTELASTAVTPGSYTNTNLTVDADGRLTAASNGSAGSGAAWALAGVGQTATGIWDQAVDGAKATVDFTGLGSYSELMILIRLVTQSVAGAIAIRLSTDNGATYLAGAADYATIDASGVATNGTFAALHTSTGVTAARTMMGYLPGININGMPKIIDRMNRDDSGSALLIGSTSPVNAIRCLPSAGGNLSGAGAKIFLLAR